MYLTNWTIIIEVNVYGLTTSCVFFLYTNPHTITTQIFLWSWELLFRFTLRKWWFSSTLTCPLQPHTAPHKITLLIFFTLLQDDWHTKFHRVSNKYLDKDKSKPWRTSQFKTKCIKRTKPNASTRTKANVSKRTKPSASTTTKNLVVGILGCWNGEFGGENLEMAELGEASSLYKKLLHSRSICWF